MRFAGVIAFGAVLGVGGCSLFVSLNGLSNGDDTSAGDASTNADGNVADTLTTTDASADANVSADGSNVFLDDFNRPDSVLLGNGWIEKQSSAYSLTSNGVLRAAFGTFNYVDGIAYRPPGEDIGDTEISIELTFASSVGGYPQIHARVQEDTVAMAGSLDSYLVYIPNSTTTATVSRTRGAMNLSDLSTMTLTETLVVGERYRLTLRVIGKGPVSLLGMVEHFESGAWKLIGETSALDSDPTQLDDAGTVGFSASTDDTDHYRYDNFMRTPL
jgi:hypothetical protein